MGVALGVLLASIKEEAVNVKREKVQEAVYI